jgi:hypothetical protein
MLPQVRWDLSWLKAHVSEWIRLVNFDEGWSDVSRSSFTEKSKPQQASNLRTYAGMQCGLLVRSYE